MTATDECPSNVETTSTGTPSRSHLVAALCRNQWGSNPIPVLAPAAGRRGLFGEWRRALGLDEVTEIPSGTGAVYLHARGVCGGVAVSVTATVFDGEGDSR